MTPVTDKAGELAPFAVGQIVETAKGARFWGEVISVYWSAPIPELPDVPSGWRVNVRAIDPGFAGTQHIYPAGQLKLRTPSPPHMQDMHSAVDAVVSDEDVQAIIDGCKGVTPGPWFYRPEKYDDWGFVRGSSPDSLPGHLIAVAHRGRDEIDGEDDIHRKTGVDPFGATAKHIARLSPEVVRSLLTELLGRRADPHSPPDVPLLHEEDR